MSNFSLAIILPETLYDTGYVNMKKYIDHLLQPYNENTEVSQYIKITKEEFDREYAEYTLEEDIGNVYSKEEFCEKVFGCTFDHNGNCISRENINGIFDRYHISTRYCPDDSRDDKYKEKRTFYREDFETDGEYNDYLEFDIVPRKPINYNNILTDEQIFRYNCKQIKNAKLPDDIKYLFDVNGTLHKKLIDKIFLDQFATDYVVIIACDF